MDELEKTLHRIEMINGNIQLYILFLWIIVGIGIVGYYKIENEPVKPVTKELPIKNPEAVTPG